MPHGIAKIQKMKQGLLDEIKRQNLITDYLYVPDLKMTQTDSE